MYATTAAEHHQGTAKRQLAGSSMISRDSKYICLQYADKLSN